MPDTRPPTPSQWLDALAGSHDRLCERVGDLDAEGLRRRSYCTEWSVAQVLAHLGSGADIFRAAVEAVSAGREPPGTDTFPPIWERWDAMNPERKAEEFAAADGALIETLERLGDGLDEFRTVMFGFMEVDAVGFLGMRLSEHALHSWDVAVAFDPSATVDPECVALLIDRVPISAGYLGKAERAGAGRPFDVVVATTRPERSLAFRVDDAVAAAAAPGGAGAQPDLVLPAEALLRLVSGRLDPGNSPAVPAAQAGALDRLRVVFSPFSPA